MNDSKTHGCKCRHCGIELITQRKSADTYCRFCGAPALISSDYEDSSLPELVIEFETDKAKAAQIYKRFLTKRPLISASFMQKVRNGHFAAVYLPVCVADIEIDTDIHALDGSGNEIHKRITSTATNAHSNAGQTIDSFLYQNLGPYDFDKAVVYEEKHTEIPFEKFADISEEAMLEIPLDEIETASIKAAMDSLGTRESIGKILSCKKSATRYSIRKVLVPVWILSHGQGGYTQQIFINGQSGKIIGEPQISFGRVAAIFAGIAAGCAVLGELIWTVVNGL